MSVILYFGCETDGRDQCPVCSMYTNENEPVNEYTSRFQRRWFSCLCFFVQQDWTRNEWRRDSVIYRGCLRPHGARNDFCTHMAKVYTWSAASTRYPVVHFELIKRPKRTNYIRTVKILTDQSRNDESPDLRLKIYYKSVIPVTCCAI